ncbi:hypothetical protein ACXDF8_15190 [Mycolicibacterium sp. CBM1]
MLLDDYPGAGLTMIGEHILRTQGWIRRYPEILDEQIDAPIVVVGMMRSGTTPMQRLLTAEQFAIDPMHARPAALPILAQQTGFRSGVHMHRNPRGSPR